MGRGASFHVKPVMSPAATEAHNTRSWSDEHQAPAYLLPDEHSLGADTVISVADVDSVHATKSALASAQARRSFGYSPLWDGVLNLDHPIGDDDDIARYADQVRTFTEGYERITGHRVIAADVHLDEGRMEDDQPIYNAHAHITIDRTDDRGRVIKLDKEKLRKIQDLAAECTGLERGADARETRRKHLDHGAYRAMARRGEARSREDVERTADLKGRLVALDDATWHSHQERLTPELYAEILRDRDAAEADAEKVRAAIPVAELYGELRGLMKASGQAKQVDYQEARQRREDRDWLVDQVRTWSKRAEAAREAQEASRWAAEERAIAAEAGRRAADVERDQARAEAVRRVDPADLRVLATELRRSRMEPKAEFSWESESVRALTEWVRLQPTRTHGRDGPSR